MSPIPSCWSCTTTTRPACCPAPTLLAAVRLVEAYVFRRAICAIPTNSTEQDLRHLRQGAQEGPLPREHPGAPPRRCRPIAASRRRRVPARPADPRPLQLPRRSYWLRRLENHGRKERVPVTSTPSSTSCRRTRPLSSLEDGARSGVGARPADLAAHARQPHAHRLQLGVQRPPFPEKRDMPKGLQGKPAQAQPGSVSSTMERRRHQGASRTGSPDGARVWPVPQLSTDVLNAYKPSSVVPRLHHRGPSAPGSGSCARFSRPFAKRCSRLTPA